MKALRIAFFACVLSVFFCFTAYADNTVTLAIPYLSSVTVTEQYVTTISTGGQQFSAGDYGYFDISNVWSSFSVINYNGVNVGGANLDYSADFVVESVSAGAGVSITRQGNRIFAKSEYVNHGTDGIPITIVYSVSAKWNRGVVPTNSAPIENCYLRVSCRVDVSAFTKTDDDMPNEWGDWHTINSTYSDVRTINSKVDQILEILNTPDTPPPPDFLGPEAIVYFDERYFPTLQSNSGTASYNEQRVVLSNASDVRFSYYVDGLSSPVISLSEGRYYFVFGIAGNNHSLKNIVIPNADIEIDTDNIISSLNSGISLLVVPVFVNKSFVSNTIRIEFNGASSGMFYGGIIPIPADDVLGGALNPSQNNKNNELNSEANKQSQQENQLWQNVNTYKSQLDFSLSGWNEATTGLSYVSDIFMAIWRNSPRQIITLSLMLGIGMLAIGRGVKAAVRQKDGDG